MKCVFDIEYDARHNLCLDLYVPDHLTTKACVIFAHSGASLSGGKSNTEVLQVADLLTRSGFAVAAIEFRQNLSLTDFPDDDAEAISGCVRRSKKVGIDLDEAYLGAAYHGAIQDISCALAFLRDEADSLAIASKRIGVFGCAAGGIAALGSTFLPNHMLSSISCPHAVVAIGSALVQPWRMQRDRAPCLLINGWNDREVPIDVARIGLSRAVAIHADFDLIEVESPEHVIMPDRALLQSSLTDISLEDRIVTQFDGLITS